MKISNFNGVNNATDDTVLAISYTTDGGTTYQTKKIRMADPLSAACSHHDAALQPAH